MGALKLHTIDQKRSKRPRSSSLSRGVSSIGRCLWVAFIVSIYIFLVGPTLIIVATSFNPSTANALPTSDLSLRWYGEFLRNNSFLDAYWFSIQLGIASAITATIIGFLTAYAISRLLRRNRTVVQSLALLPAMVPGVLISLSLLLALNFVPFPPLIALFVGHVIHCLPFTITGVLISLDAVDPQLEPAAMTLGSSRLRCLIEIVLPLTATGLLSALIFSFIISFGDVYLALFLSGPGTTTLPIEIFSFVQWDSSPVVAAITSTQIALILVLGLIVERLVGLRRMMRV